MSEHQGWAGGPKDIEALIGECAMFVFRPAGARPGASAVRLTHLPTGIVAESSDGRTQLENLERAMRSLRDLVNRG